MRLKILTVITLLLLLSFPVNARYRPMSLAELKTGSDVIAVVDISKVHATSQSSGHWVYHQSSELHPVQLLKGRVTEGSRVLRDSDFACDSGGLTEGKQYLLFLKRTPEGFLVSTNYGNGVYQVVDGRVEFFASRSDPRKTSQELTEAIALLR